MSITTISTQTVYSQVPVTAEQKPQVETKNQNPKTEKEANAIGATYESSDTTTTAGEKEIQRKQIISQLKADAEKRSEQLMNLVSEMFSKQGKIFNSANDIWSILASGDFTVDPEVKRQAQEDISADGYWGVEKTSDRILSFAEALSGGDPKTMEKMREAFQKGFDQATKTWGKELPELCKNTYDAVMKKFDKWATEITM